VRDASVTAVCGVNVSELDVAGCLGEFGVWLSRFSPVYRRTVLNYLRRYFPDRIGYAEMVRVLSLDFPGRRHLQLALRCFFNFLEDLGVVPGEVLERFRRAVRVDRTGIDNYCPDDSRVAEAYGRLRKPVYRLAFRVLGFSGIRLAEAVEFLRVFDPGRVEVHGRVSLYPLASVRGGKICFYVFLPSELMAQVERIQVSVSALEQSLVRAGMPAKYLRKWNYNRLIDHMSESLADFVQGRSIQSVGGLHYLDRRRKAIQAYAKVIDDIASILPVAEPS
jgi:intergrase/recombinase